MLAKWSSGTASDTVSMSSVAVAIDGGAYALATGTSNWTFSLNTLSLTNGSHTIAAKAWDMAGNTALVSITSIVNNRGPTLVIISPANGATISGLITVSGTASDTVSISSVAVSVDGGAYALATGTSNWTFILDTTSLPNGSHTITAKAWDVSGNTALVSITVAPPGAPNDHQSAAEPKCCCWRASHIFSDRRRHPALSIRVVQKRCGDCKCLFQFLSNPSRWHVGRRRRLLLRGIQFRGEQHEHCCDADGDFNFDVHDI